MIQDVLVLNCDYQPLGETTIRRALELVRRDRADIEEHCRRMFSAKLTFVVPDVVRMKRMVDFRDHRVALTKRMILTRDRDTCQYCGSVGGRLTLDHVNPRSKGGPSSWENLVAACFRCNQYKDDRTPAQAGMRLRRIPREPSRTQVLRLSARGQRFIEMMNNGTFSFGQEIA